MKKILFVLLGAGFLFFGIAAYMQSEPAPKSKRVYQAIRHYSPYYLEKRFGGLQIRSKTDKNFKEKPSNMEVFHRLDSLEKTWGKAHLTLKDSALIVHDKNGTQLGTILLKTPDEKAFVHAFYGL
jgi:ATP/ADP translocase